MNAQFDFFHASRFRFPAEFSIFKERQLKKDDLFSSFDYNSNRLIFLHLL